MGKREGTNGSLYLLTTKVIPHELEHPNSKQAQPSQKPID